MEVKLQIGLIQDIEDRLIPFEDPRPLTFQSSPLRDIPNNAVKATGIPLIVPKECNGRLYLERRSVASGDGERQTGIRLPRYIDLMKGVIHEGCVLLVHELTEAGPQ